MSSGESESCSEGSLSPPSSSSMLKFSISRILDTDFGARPSLPTVTPLRISTTPPALPVTSSLGFVDQRAAFPAWIYSTRYSDRPSSGSRSRRLKRKDSSSSPSAPVPLPSTTVTPEDEKRPRTAFTSDQLDVLKRHFVANRYLTEKRRQELAHELGLNESQIKIWFQNKRAKLKKASMERSALATILLGNTATSAFQLPSTIRTPTVF